jgi:hypothetical protein
MQTYLPPDDDQTQRTPPELRLLIVLLMSCWASFLSPWGPDFT